MTRGQSNQPILRDPVKSIDEGFYRIGAAQNETNLTTGVGRYARVGVIDNRIQFLAAFGQWFDNILVKPHVLAL